MPRTSQLIHPQRKPAPARPAATVLLLRDSPQGIEVLMTRRSEKASFLPGAHVFPGGGIDAQDAQGHHLCRRRPGQSDLQVTQAIAAIRESFEELGVLLARHRDGSHATTADIAALDRHSPFAAHCPALGLTLAADEVFLLAHWIADRDIPRRFDVPFLVARMPQGQEPVADNSEQFEPIWLRPCDALTRHTAGELLMIFPTIRTLERLQAYADVDAVLEACAASEEPLWMSCPRTGLLQGKESRYMEHEAPFGELALVCPDGQVLHQLDWQSSEPVRLLENVMRLTAPNPGFMTGPGTNSYLIGDANTGYLVVDPGPADSDHLMRLFDAAAGDIRMIVCTHSHPDHSPGALPLQSICAERSPARPPICGLSSGPSARADSLFAPDRTLRNQELLTLVSHGPEAQIIHTLKVIHTPGHAANHLCLVLLEDGLLLSGDHILNGSTTIVSPPDGDMTDYLASLDTLSAACDEHGIEFILPAHGYVLGEARAAITRLKAHRLAREAKVQAAMRQFPRGTLDDWVPLAYDDVDARIWPVAKRSLQAHVDRILTLEATGQTLAVTAP